MRRRRSDPQCFQLARKSEKVNWLVVETMWHKTLEVKPLPPGSDLLIEYLQLLLRYARDGWELSEFSSTNASAWAIKHATKLHLGIIPTDPTGRRHIGN